MPVQRVAHVLGENVDLAEPRVDAVGHCKIDNPVLSAKGNGGFGPVSRERVQPLTLTAGKHQDKSFL